MDQIAELNKKIENHITLTKKEFEHINSCISDVKKIVEKFSLIYVKDDKGLIARYERADFEMELYNEIRRRPTTDVVNKLIKTEIDLTPRIKLGKFGEIAKNWSSIINLLVLIGMIVFFAVGLLK